MPTLNQLAERVATIVNQPFNHNLKERVKDMIKNGIANRIRQSTEKNGIDEILKLSFIVPVVEVTPRDIFNYPNVVLDGKTKILVTEYKIPMPVRIYNDAPYTFVGRVSGESFIYATQTESRFRLTSSPTGIGSSYFIENQRLFINSPRLLPKYYKDVNKVIDDRRPLNEIKVQGIFENPEEVLSMYQNIDGQDIELPFPGDMMENIILEILRTEFNLIPKDSAITINPTNFTRND